MREREGQSPGEEEMVSLCGTAETTREGRLEGGAVSECERQRVQITQCVPHPYPHPTTQRYMYNLQGETHHDLETANPLFDGSYDAASGSIAFTIALGVGTRVAASTAAAQTGPKSAVAAAAHNNLVPSKASAASPKASGGAVSTGAGGRPVSFASASAAGRCGERLRFSGRMDLSTGELCGSWSLTASSSSGGSTGVVGQKTAGSIHGGGNNGVVPLGGAGQRGGAFSLRLLFLRQQPQQSRDAAVIPATAAVAAAAAAASLVA